MSEIHNDLVEEIRRLKAERDAIIIAHNYQNPEVQDIADIVGDSLHLHEPRQSATERDCVL